MLEKVYLEDIKPLELVRLVDDDSDFSIEIHTIEDTPGMIALCAFDDDPGDETLRVDVDIDDFLAAAEILKRLNETGRFEA